METPDSRLNYIWHCEAMSLFKALDSSSVDAVITDIPYGLAGRVFEFPHHKYTAINEEWDQTVPTDWMAEANRVVKPTGCVVCFGVRQSTYEVAHIARGLGWRLINDITWYKPDAPPNFTGRMLTESTERILWFSPSGSRWTYNLAVAKLFNGNKNFRDVWTFGITREHRYHPAQKPLDLMGRIVALFTNPNDVIVDPFAGSGSTLVAARDYGRSFIGADISQEYVTIAKERVGLISRQTPTNDLPMFKSEEL